MTYNRPSYQYFENQVQTATPQRLHLMLIDGALQFARKAILHWQEGRIYEGGEAVIGCQRIITELLRGLKVDVDPDLVGKVAAIYNFVFRALIEAGMKRDVSKLNEAIAVLEVERETWRQVCEKLGTPLDTSQPSATRMPHFVYQAGQFTSHTGQMASGGISINA